MLISVLSLVPGDQLPESPVKYTDLAVHVLMYAAWMFVLGLELQRQYSPPTRRLWVICLLIMVFYGGLIEVLQESFIPGRYGSISDALANISGSLLLFYHFHFKARRDQGQSA